MAYVVRGKSGKVIGRYATRAEAEQRLAQLRKGAERLRGYRFSDSPSRHLVFEFRILRGGLPPMVFYTKKGLNYWLRSRKPTSGSYEVIERPPIRIEERAIREGRGDDAWLWKENSPHPYSKFGSARLSAYNKFFAPYGIRIGKDSHGGRGYTIRQGIRPLMIGVQDVSLAAQRAKEIIEGRRTPTYGEYVPPSRKSHFWPGQTARHRKAAKLGHKRFRNHHGRDYGRGG
jgi:hypothetical protein